MEYDNRLNTETYENQQFSIKSDVEEICHDVKQCHSSPSLILFWKIPLFFIKICATYILT